MARLRAITEPISRSRAPMPGSAANLRNASRNASRSRFGQPVSGRMRSVLILDSPNKCGILWTFLSVENWFVGRRSIELQWSCKDDVSDGASCSRRRLVNEVSLVAGLRSLSHRGTAGTVNRYTQYGAAGVDVLRQPRPTNAGLTGSRPGIASVGLGV